MTRSYATTNALCRLKYCQQCITVRKVTLERLALGHDLEGDSRSLDLLYSIGYISHPTSGLYSVVTTILSGTVSEILPLMVCT